MRNIKVRLLNSGGFSGMGDFIFKSILNGKVCYLGDSVVYIDRDEIAKHNGFPKCSICAFVVDTECEVVNELNQGVKSC